MTTNDGQYDGSGNAIEMRICQDSLCCNTTTLPGRYDRGQTTTFTDSSVLNDCSNLLVNVDKTVDVTLVFNPTSGNDGWRGDKIWIATGQGNVLECPSDVFLKRGTQVRFSTTCIKKGKLLGYRLILRHVSAGRTDG